MGSSSSVSQEPSHEVVLRNKSDRHTVCVSGASQKGSAADGADVTFSSTGKPDIGLLDHLVQPFPSADEDSRDKKLTQQGHIASKHGVLGLL